MQTGVRHRRHGEATLVAPNDKLAWHLLGRALHGLDLLDEAAEAQRRAIALDPEFRDGWRWLGYSLETDGALIGAAQAYQRARAALRAKDGAASGAAWSVLCH